MAHAFNSLSLRDDNIRPQREGFINCVRCSECRPSRQTDLTAWAQSLEFFDASSVPSLNTPEFAAWAREADEVANIEIYCRKVGHKRRARLFGKCAEANPMPLCKRHEVGLPTYQNGNRRRSAGALEKQFVRLAYPRAHKLALRLVCDRDYLSIINLGNREGVARDEEIISCALQRMAPRQRAARVAIKNCFNDEQSAYILARFSAGKNCESFEGLPSRLVWPRKIGGVLGGKRSHTRREAQGVINEAIKAHIVNEVAKLGYEMSWDAIRRHPEFKAPGYYRKHKNAKIERMARGPKNNSLSRPQKRKHDR